MYQTINESLFKNMAIFAHAVWRFDLEKEIIEPLSDSFRSERVGQYIPFSSLKDVLSEYVSPSDMPFIMGVFSKQSLTSLQETKVYTTKPFKNHGKFYSFKGSLTPERDEEGRVRYIYLTLLNTQSLIDAKNMREEYKRILSAVTCGIIQYTKHTKKILYANRIALKLMGYSNIEELQKNFNGTDIHVNKEDAKRIKSLVRSLKKVQDVVNFTYKTETVEGPKFFFGTAQLIDDNAPEPIVQRSLIDVTSTYKERSNNISALLQALDFVGEEMGVMAFVFDMDKQEAYVEKEFAKRWGVEPIKKGVPYAEAVSERVSEEYRTEYVRIHEDVMNGKESSKGVVGLVHPNGKTDLFELSLRVIKDDEGNLTRKALGVYKPKEK